MVLLLEPLGTTLWKSVLTPRPQTKTVPWNGRRKGTLGRGFPTVPGPLRGSALRSQSLPTHTGHAPQTCRGLFAPGLSRVRGRGRSSGRRGGASWPPTPGEAARGRGFGRRLPLRVLSSETNRVTASRGSWLRRKARASGYCSFTSSAVKEPPSPQLRRIDPIFADRANGYREASAEGESS